MGSFCVSASKAKTAIARGRHRAGFFEPSSPTKARLWRKAPLDLSPPDPQTLLTPCLPAPLGRHLNSFPLDATKSARRSKSRSQSQHLWPTFWRPWGCAGGSATRNFAPRIASRRGPAGPATSSSNWMRPPSGPLSSWKGLQRPLTAPRSFWDSGRKTTLRKATSLFISSNAGPGGCRRAIWSSPPKNNCDFLQSFLDKLCVSI